MKQNNNSEVQTAFRELYLSKCAVFYRSKIYTKVHSKYTYKRATSLHFKTLSAERIGLFWETIYIQEFLATAGYKRIWVDEFHSNIIHIWGYNWLQRGV